MRKTIFIIGLIFFSLQGYSQKSLVGKPAPKIEIDNWIYPKIQVADWQTKQIPENLEGKIVVLDFWFTHCAPCVASIPELNSIARQFPEIVFLSVSFEKEEVINNFLNKMVMYYPVGSDPEKKTIKAFGVSSYPETFLIDKNGIIQWQGSPFHLTGKVLNEFMGREEKKISLRLNNREIPSKNYAYSFTIQKHNLEMGQSTYYHFNPFDINVFNKDLENMLQVFYGINKSRILSDDSTLLKTTYDLTLKADKEITTEANCVEMLKYLLPEQLEMTIKKVSKDTLVNIIRIENDSLLNLHISDYKYFFTSVRYGNWEAKGAKLENLVDFIENEYNILVALDQQDDRKFEFLIPIKDLEKFKEKLFKDYGLIIYSEKQKTDFWKINQKKVH